MDQELKPAGRKLPSWMKMQKPGSESYLKMKKLLKENNLHTICTSGNCPNIGECWDAGHATFMILGDICTRSCKFCLTKTGKPLPPDPAEPLRVARSVNILKLKHCVITSVDRDDLPDAGAAFWAETITKVKEMNPGIRIETLIPDFDGREECISRVIEARPDVISHNLETVRSLTPLVRSKASYDTSLKVISFIASGGITAKSGIMLGLGEKHPEILETMDDLVASGCSVMTLGQYLQPGLSHMKAVDYIHPDRFQEYREEAFKRGFRFVESGPLVRSSYHADQHT